MATIDEALDSLSNPKIKHIVSVSGGKDSSALAIYMLRKYPQIPVEYVFCDTGCELPETYEFLERLECLLGTEIKRLNALDSLGVKKKHGRTPFDVWLKEVYGGFLPNPRTRWCTRVLKIEPFEAHVGEQHVFSYIGIRADEDREGYVSRKPAVISERPNILPIYPFRDDGLGLADIHQLLEDSGLGMPEYYRWRSRSGCYFCFYQQIGEWQGLQENHPDLFTIARSYEKTSGSRKFTWLDGRTLENILDLPKHELLPPKDGCAICHL